MELRGALQTDSSTLLVSAPSHCKGKETEAQRMEGYVERCGQSSWQNPGKFKGWLPAHYCIRVGCPDSRVFYDRHLLEPLLPFTPLPSFMALSNLSVFLSYFSIFQGDVAPLSCQEPFWNVLVLAHSGLTTHY